MKKLFRSAALVLAAGLSLAVAGCGGDEAPKIGAEVAVTDDGARVTMLAPAQTQLAVVDLPTVHPLNVNLERRLVSLFDVKKLDGGRALIATHAAGGGGLTILDALAPSLATSREAHGLFLGDHL